MNILFIGDICGKIGRKTVANILPKLKKSHQIDLVIANADNVAHGSGVTEETLKELMAAGVDFFTNGDHAFDNIKGFEAYEKLPIIRAANYLEGVPGRGYKIIKVGKQKILVINLLGRVFMKMDYECPFKKIDEILAKNPLLKKGVNAIIIDVHAEASSEKICLKHYLDGKVSAILGTHTHVQTADAEITSQGTGYITDAGMVGYSEGAIGLDLESPLKTFLTQIKYPFTIPQKGRAIFNAVVVDVNSKTGRASSIKPVTKFIEIK